MKRSSLEQWGYALCWRGDWVSDLWSRFFFRWYCPHPIIDNPAARVCVQSGNCGCDNKYRYSR